MTNSTPEETTVTEQTDPKPRRQPRKKAEPAAPAEPTVEVNQETQVPAEPDALEKLAETSVAPDDLEVRVPEPEQVLKRGSIVDYVTRAGVLRPAIVVSDPSEGEFLDLVVFNQQNGAIFVPQVPPGNAGFKNSYVV